MKKEYFCCEIMDIYEQEEVIIVVPKFREIGIPVLDGGSSYIVISYCPWCGSKLPNSLRDDWFAILEKLNVDSCDDKMIPNEMKSSEWWEKLKTKDGEKK